MDQPFVVEEMIGEVDPNGVPGAVTALRKNEWNSFLRQELLVLSETKPRSRTSVILEGPISCSDRRSVVTSLTEPGSARIITGSPVSVALKSAMLT